MPVYYNEFDKKAAQHLRNAISNGLVAPGDVDDRNIRDVLPSDLDGYDQHHFFAGIGIWSLALRWAGWPDDRPVWTGSCPCQPFSAAGGRKGFVDERHVWPFWHWLIQQSGPDTIFGEQVASPDGLAWLDLVSTDLEASGYAIGAGDQCSAGVGAPNIRQRLYWVADATGSRHARTVANAESDPRDETRLRLLGSFGAVSRLANTEGGRRREHWIFSSTVGERQDAGQPAQRDKDAVRLGDAGNAGLPHPESLDSDGAWRGQEGRAASEPGRPPDPWRELEWIDCRDGKRRPTKPSLFPLAARHPGDVGILRTAGNAINPYVAETFIRAYLES